MARIKPFRILFSLETQFNWHVFHFDVKFAFLNEDIQEEVFVEQPKGYVVKGSEHKVYKFK